MTELSYPWDGTATGDAVVAHYIDDEWSDYWGMLLHYDRTLDGVIATNHDGFIDNLEVTSPSSSTLRVAPGIGLVDGKVYTNDAVIDFPGNAEGSYSVVLRKDWALQTVRVAVRTAGVTQNDGVLWEIKLADADIDSAGAATITDQRRFLRNAPRLSNRQGGSATVWDTAGSSNYLVQNTMMQMGIRTISFGAGDLSVSHATTFPRAYAYAPIVLTTIRSLSVWTEVDYNIYSLTADATTTNFTITARREATTDGAVTLTYFWLAMGEPEH